MKTRSGTNVWYLLVLITLALVFIFAGIKYLGNGDRIRQQPGSNSSSISEPKDDSKKSTTENLPLDQQYAAKGAESINNKNYQEAIDFFTKAIAANPSDTSYYSLKAQAEILAGQTADAKSTLESGLKVDPDNELLNSKLDVLNNASNLAPADQDTPRL